MCCDAASDQALDVNLLMSFKMDAYSSGESTSRTSTLTTELMVTGGLFRSSIKVS